MNTENLDYIKIDIIETSTETPEDDYISAAPNMKDVKYKSEFIIPPTRNHAFSNNEALDDTIFHKRLANVMDKKVDKMTKLDIILDLSKRKTKRYRK